MMKTITKLLCIAGVLAFGLAFASAAEAKCKKGYERIGGKCVKKCKVGQGRRNGTGKCTTICKPGQTRDASGKCVTFIEDIGDLCHPPLTICHTEEGCDDEDEWLLIDVCSSFNLDADNMCVEVSRSIDTHVMGSCQGQS